MDTRGLEDLAGRLARVLPPGMQGLRGEMERNFRAILRANLERLDLVARDRFDAQTALLERTRKQLQSMEQRLSELEALHKAESKTSGRDKQTTT